MWLAATRSVFASRARVPLRESGGGRCSTMGVRAMESYSEENEKKLFICDFAGCGKQFKRNYNVQVHRRTHTGEKPFRCPFKDCGDKFKWRSTLRTHCSCVHRMELPSTENCLVSAEEVDTSGSERREQRREEHRSKKRQTNPRSTLKAMKNIESFQFYTQIKLYGDLRPEHLPEGSRLLQCPESNCGCLFNDHECLEMHMHEHEHEHEHASSSTRNLS